MITTTHIVTNALVNRRWPGLLAAPRWFVVGGLAPDVGLTVMSVGAAVVLPRTRGISRDEALRIGFEDLFFNSKPWIAAANVFHSPVVLGALLAASFTMSGTKADRLRSFALGAALHTAMDIPVHVDDGPVLLWPLNWNYRFESAFSYWDRDHFGGWVAPIDIGITVLGGASLLRSFLKNRR